MARHQDFPTSRKRAIETGATWVVAMLGLGVLAAIILVAVVPDENASRPAVEQVIPNTPPPVRTE